MRIRRSVFAIAAGAMLTQPVERTPRHWIVLTNKRQVQIFAGGELVQVLDVFERRDGERRVRDSNQNSIRQIQPDV